MSKSLININRDIATGLDMLKELCMHGEEWDDEEREKFAAEIVKSIVGDEKTFVANVQNIVAFFEHVENDCDRASKYVIDIEKQKRVAQNTVKRMKEYTLAMVKEVSSKLGGKSVDSGDVRISWQKYGEAEPIEIIDETRISHTCFDDVVETRRVLNRDKLRAALKAGEKIEGARIIPQRERINIKTILPKGG